MPPKSALLTAFPLWMLWLSLFARFSTFIYIRGIVNLLSSDPYAFALLCFLLEWWMYHAFSIVFHGDPSVLMPEATITGLLFDQSIPLSARDPNHQATNDKSTMRA